MFFNDKCWSESSYPPPRSKNIDFSMMECAWNRCGDGVRPSVPINLLGQDYLGFTARLEGHERHERWDVFFEGCRSTS